MEQKTLRAEDGYKLDLHIFETENARDCVQIIHGMEEHKERYDAFAQELQKAGFTVVSSDMRGHGVGAPELGFFKEKDGYKLLLSDQKRITDYIRERFGVKKVNIFAHSMGTIIARNLLQTESAKYERVVLSGYPYHPGKAAVAAGFLLTDVIGLVKGPKYHSKLVQMASTGSFNKAIQNSKTKLDWLSVNEENVATYLDDPYCGHGFSVSAYHDLFSLVSNMENVALYKHVDKNLPILMLRGKEDPSTGFDKGAKQSVATLRTAGFARIKTIEYDNMRHEILNEKEKQKVIDDVIAFYRA